VLTSLEPATAPDSGFVAVGRLTFHGITRDLRFPASVIRDTGNYAIDGDATVDTREFGLPIIRMMGVLKVDPLVHVRFHLQGHVEP
jgi:polyisoprenoid-binding protein YceI